VSKHDTFDELLQPRQVAGGAVPQGQGSEGIRGPLTGSAGGSVNVNVGPNDSSIDVANSADGKTSTHSVSPGKDTSIPIPDVPPGTVLTIRIGTGLNARVIVVEVVAPGP
jgi:hypothetical protein